MTGTRPFIDYSDIGRLDFMAEIKANFSDSQYELIHDAYQIAKYSHRNQERDSGRRYFDHPKQVAIICLKEFKVKDSDVIISALLHDVSEDTYILSNAAMERLFGMAINRIIVILSKLPKEGYHRRLIESECIEAWIVKLADNLHNTRTLDGCPPEKRKRKLQETKDVYYPLIDRLRKNEPTELVGLADTIQRLFGEAIAYQESP